MTVTAITLTDPATGVSVPILPVTGVAAQILDVSAPARAVTEERVGAAGAYDSTRLLSSAAVTLTMLLYPDGGATPEAFLAELGQLLDPGLRPNLIVDNDVWDGPRQLTVRFDSASMPLSSPTNWPVQVSWRAPNAVWQGATLQTVATAAFIPSTTGLTWATAGVSWSSAGIVWPPSSAAVPVLASNEGNYSSQWTALMYGPCTGPKLANDGPELTLEFTDALTLGAGEYVLLDSVTRTAYRNGDTSLPVLSYLNFPTSNWWLIGRGDNPLRYYPSSAAAGSLALVTFAPSWQV